MLGYHICYSPPSHDIQSVSLHKVLEQISLIRPRFASFGFYPGYLATQPVFLYMTGPFSPMSLSPVQTTPARRPPGRLALVPPLPLGHLLGAGLLLFKSPYMLSLKSH